MGQWEEAQEQLQLAARWSQTPKDHIVALNNLGAVHWHQLSDVSEEAGLEGEAARERARRLMQRDLLYFSPDIKNYPRYPKGAVVPVKYSSRARVLSAAQLSIVREALAYWDDAIEEATKAGDDTNSVRDADQC
jgi:hypothetical protein